MIFNMTNRLKKTKNPENRFVNVFNKTYCNFGIKFF